VKSLVNAELGADIAYGSSLTRGQGRKPTIRRWDAMPDGKAQDNSRERPMAIPRDPRPRGGADEREHDGRE
jgi:hypothetical protein